MTTEDDFQAALDANPDDHNTRLVFADWLQERDDPRAEGYRALGVAAVRPYPMDWVGQRWAGYGRTDNSENPATRPGGEAFGALVPPDWFGLFCAANQLPDWTSDWWAYFTSRRTAEDAAALAFAGLPLERRVELLAGT